MEQFLDKVEEGDINWVNIIREFYGDFSTTLKKAEKEMQYVKIAPEESDVVCEKCGRKMVIRESYFFIGLYLPFLVYSIADFFGFCNMANCKYFTNIFCKKQRNYAI